MNKKIDLTVPDFITISNASIGFLAITYILDDRLWIASMLIVLCVALDGIDGAVARYLQVEHEFGAQLDFFSDLISFCFAPSLLLYHTFYDLDLGRGWESPQNALATAIPVMIVFLGTMRLARFADKTSKKGRYTGLPTPCLALLILNFSYLFGWGKIDLYFPYLTLLFIGLLSLMLYTKIEYPKFRDLKTQIGGSFFLLLMIVGLIFSNHCQIIGSYFIILSTLLLLGYVFISPVIVKIHGKRREGNGVG